VPYANPVAAKEYNRAYRLANPERVRANHLKHRAANREKLAARSMAYYGANADKVVLYRKARRVSCGDDINARKREQYAAARESENARSAAYRAENVERCREYRRAYSQGNRAQRNAWRAAYTARKLSATPPWLTKEDYNEILKFYAEAKRLNHHVDHVVPLRGKNVSGLHVPWNLQVLPPHENARKGNAIV
jgi:5-methylcytosine-specific restriction endonuclease McrA